ncbi:MAG: large subunit ribosomal protein L21 [Flammeovirgaceae bacterium]
MLLQIDIHIFVTVSKNKQFEIMYAIVEIAGHQYKVEKDKYIYTQKLQGEVGDAIEFDSVLLMGDGDSISVGAPSVSGALVKAEVLDHLRGERIVVFKKKRRKGYKKRNGHRQNYTKILITDIVS